MKELFQYDPETGVFVRAGHPKRGFRASGRGVVGCITTIYDGRTYIRICVDYRVYLAHRLVFLYMTGRIPEIVDHIDGDGTNNRWSNLREASRSQNLQNTRRHRDNMSGFKGVYWHKRDKKWMTRIKANGKEIYIGSFDDPSEAHEAYISAAKRYFGKFANAG